MKPLNTPNDSLTLVNPADPQRFERVQDVLAEVLDAPVEHRTARLDELAGSDPPLRVAVAELVALAEAADRAGFLRSVEESPTASGHNEASLLPEVIGPYRVLAQLGEGGTGVVFLAESPAPMHRRVAVKLARSSVRGQIASRADIEVEALASLNHPGIAQVYETGVLDDGRRWTACELVDGEWINRAVASAGWRIGIELLALAAEAVHHAHQCGVIHRDLKPSNLLVPNDAVTPTVKVIDFGVARLLSPRTGTDAATEPGLLVGTLAYMSPEQLSGRAVDARTDVYGLGLVAAEVLTGRAPPGRSGGLAELTSAAKDPVRIRLAACGGHERDLEAVIATATDPEPGSRYSSMQHFADDLRRVLANEPVVARRPGALWRVWLYANRRPWTFAATLVACVVIAGLIAALTVSRNNLSTEVQDQRQFIGELVTDTLTGLGDIRGTREQRDAMVGTLFERLSRQLTEHPNDPDLRSLQARLLRERGDIAANLGRFDDAMDDLSQSRDAYAVLAGEGFGGLTLGRLHAEGIVRVGDVVLERDRALGVAEAMNLYRDAMSIQKMLVDQYPKDLGLLDDLCWSYDRIGDLGDKWRAIPDAELETWLCARVAMSESLLALDSERPHSRFNLATGYQRLAHFYGMRERNEESAAAVAAGFPHILAAMRAEPDRTLFVQIMITMRSWEARTLSRLGRVDEVPAVVETLVDTARAHVRLLPGEVDAEGIYVSTLIQAVGTLMDVGQSEEARSYANEALARLPSLRAIVSPSRHPELDAEEALLRELMSPVP